MIYTEEELYTKSLDALEDLAEQFEVKLKLTDAQQGEHRQ